LKAEDKDLEVIMIQVQQAEKQQGKSRVTSADTSKEARVQVPGIEQTGPAIKAYFSINSTSLSWVPYPLCSIPP
jgi:hypothetical protein